MLSAPKVGQRVRLRYGAGWAPESKPHDGKAGTVILSGRGRPRNHLVHLDGGETVVVPAGHLVKE